MDERKVVEFKETVWDFYHDHGRHDLPWRLAEADESFDPYKILVSEIMLQQTQVSRVIPKYVQFLGRFPNISSLAIAPLGDVLTLWNGLGYNRRAKFLLHAAQKIVQEFGGNFPTNMNELQRLPGVGMNTAGAVASYAFNQPLVFIETNIRTVFIHHFFKDEVDIPDIAIRTLVEQTLDREHPREWYWALMDYGSFLKQTVGNLSRASKSYVRQSKFTGSRRQLRGAIIRVLLSKSYTRMALVSELPDERLDAVLTELINEGLIHQDGEHFSVA